MTTGLGYYVQTAQTEVLAEEFGWQLETLTNSDKLQLLLCTSQTLYQHEQGDPTHTLRNALSELPSPCTSRVVRAIAILKGTPDAALKQLLIALSHQLQ